MNKHFIIIQSPLRANEDNLKLEEVPEPSKNEEAALNLLSDVN